MKNKKIIKICPICKKGFESYKCKKRKFCSLKCTGKWQSKYRNGKNSHFYIDGRCSKKYYCKCGREIHRDTYLYGNKTCNHCSHLKDGRSLKDNFCIEVDCKKKISWNAIRCRKCSDKVHSKLMKKIFSGKNHPNYINGKGNFPYPIEFSDSLKESIRKRDNYECQNCGMTEEEHLIVHGQVLHVHHIDYNKNNCEENNLVTTCLHCNLRANFNRDYWYVYFTYKIKENTNV